MSQARNLTLFAVGAALLFSSMTNAPLAGSQHSDGQSASYVPGEIIVKFKVGTTAVDRLRTALELGKRSSHAFRSGAELWRLDPAVTVETALQRTRKNPFIEYAEPNYHLVFAVEPDDPQFSNQWNLKNVGQTGGVTDADIDAELAWDTETGDGSVVVAVIDTGVDFGHEDLENNIWTNTGETVNGIDDDGNGYIDDIRGWDFAESICGDPNYPGDNDPSPYTNGTLGPLCSVINPHGTRVASILAADANNSVGMAGVVWDVQIMPIRVQAGNVCMATEAIQYACDKGADVINASWKCAGECSAVRDAIDDAACANTVFVAAAMNDGTDNDVLPFYPASYDLDNIIAVAGTDHDDRKVPSSNYGNTSVDLAAPSKGILTAEPREGDNPPGFCPGDTVVGPSTYAVQAAAGTSHATPHVAGVAALMRALDPGSTVAEIKCSIIATTDYTWPIWTTVSSGRLNAKAALDRLLASGQPCKLPDPYTVKIAMTIHGSSDPNYPFANLLSLPYENIFQGNNGPEKLCDAFGLSESATVIQYDGLGNTFTHECGNHAQWELLDLKGIKIIELEPGPKQGIIEGSDDPNAVVVIEELGGGTVGKNLFPVRYNGKALTPKDLCEDCGLSDDAEITRYDAEGENVLSHRCDALVAVWDLVLGEAVLITEPTGQVICQQPSF